MMNVACIHEYKDYTLLPRGWVLLNSLGEQVADLL